MNEIQVTLRGNVATEPRHVRFDDGNSLTSFRLASTVRSYDRERQEWVDRGTTFVDVTCRRAMAANAAASVHKGQPMVVTGRLRERFWTADGRSGHTLEVTADSLGHDLTYGRSEFVRIARTERAPVDVTNLTVLDGGGEDEMSGDEDLAGLQVVDGSELMDEGPVPVAHRPGEVGAGAEESRLTEEALA